VRGNWLSFFVKDEHPRALCALVYGCYAIPHAWNYGISSEKVAKAQDARYTAEYVPRLLDLKHNLGNQRGRDKLAQKRGGCTTVGKAHCSPKHLKAAVFSDSSHFHCFTAYCVNCLQLNVHVLGVPAFVTVTSNSVYGFTAQPLSSRSST